MILFGSEPSRRQAHRVHVETAQRPLLLLSGGGKSNLCQISEHLCLHTGDYYLPSSARLVPPGDHLRWGQKKVALSQLPFLLLLKPYTAMTAHTSPQVPVRSQLRGLCPLKCQVSPMGVWVGCCIFSSVRFVQGPLRMRVSLETHCSYSAEYLRAALSLTSAKPLPDWMCPLNLQKPLCSVLQPKQHLSDCAAHVAPLPSLCSLCGTFPVQPM